MLSAFLPGVFLYLTLKNEIYAVLPQLTVDILIVDRCVHSFFLELVREEEQIDLVVTLVR
jgi:hypothetical protein